MCSLRMSWFCFARQNVFFRSAPAARISCGEGSGMRIGVGT